MPAGHAKRIGWKAMQNTASPSTYTTNSTVRSVLLVSDIPAGAAVSGGSEVIPPSVCLPGGITVLTVVRHTSRVNVGVGLSCLLPEQLLEHGDQPLHVLVRRVTHLH